jgi:Tfp pilus assembly protein PilF
MQDRGVTCSDCHDPHSGRPRAAGDAVCAQCHRRATYDSTDHHRHVPGSNGASCVACHMSTTTYMEVDPRHDHSFRIPRPDRTITLGTPKACNACHSRQSPEWAREALRKWFPKPNPGFQTFAEAFHAADLGAAGAAALLRNVASDPMQPPIVRASAWARLGRYPSAETLTALSRALDEADANVRTAAVGALASFDAPVRLRLLPRMLDDTLRVVRIEAARLLAGPAEAELTEAVRAKLERALAEYVAVQQFNADRAESHANLAGLYLARGQLGDAEKSLRKALAIDPAHAPAAVALADLHHGRGAEADAEAALRAALAADPRSAPVQHALGLSLVRQKRMREALSALREAASRAPENPRFAYVYAIALGDTGQRVEARRILNEALKRHPYDRHILFALASLEVEAGDKAKAALHTRVLQELEPRNPDVAALAARVGTAAPQSAPAAGGSSPTPR